MATPEEQTRTMIANLEANTGKTLDQWIAIVKKSGLDKHGQVVRHLKSEHGLTHGYANLVAHSARSSDASSQDDDSLVTAQYDGKETLRPAYDRLIGAVRAFGSDVEISPKKTYVSLRRSKQFALVQPSTRTRLDVGIQLKGLEVDGTGRLEESGSFNAMVSHRVRVSGVDEIDDELVGWLRTAYDAA